MKFTKQTSYDPGYGYQSEYVFEEWSISKYSVENGIYQDEGVML